MSDFRVLIRLSWRGAAFLTMAAAVAYARSRTSRASTAASIAQLSATVDSIALYVRKVDYWNVYEQAQADLLGNERNLE